MNKLLLILALSITACAPQQGYILVPGKDGTNGKDGANGQDGKDGTSIEMIKFCPQETQYPTSFPEYGFCIEGKLYATYYDKHNAWTSEIPPGLYMSTSTNAPCNFIVHDNCKITQQ